MLSRTLRNCTFYECYSCVATQLLCNNISTKLPSKRLLHTCNNASGIVQKGRLFPHANCSLFIRPYFSSVSLLRRGVELSTEQFSLPAQNAHGLFKTHDAQQQLFHQQILNVMDNNGTPMDYIKRVIKEYALLEKEEPFFVMDVGQVLIKHQEWCENLPRVKPYYAIKANNNSVLLAVLARLGCNFDCASLQEIEDVLSVGVEPHRIIYANPCKTPSFIRHAQMRGVKMMTFDQASELKKIQKNFPNAGLILRIAVADPTAVCQLNEKFGCDPETVAPELLKSAAILGLNVIGISFHVGSGCRTPDAFSEAITHSKRLMDIGQQYGHDMHLLDIGGGYPGVNSNEISLAQIANVINNSLDVHFPEGCGIEIIGEPGRFYAATPYSLCVNIISRRTVAASRITNNAADDHDIGYMYFINDGIYGSLNSVLSENSQPTPSVLKAKDESQYWCSVWGPTCDSIDCVIKKCRLPQMEEGDWIAIHDIGAYTMSISSDFSGFPKPAVYYVIKDSDMQILVKSHQSISTIHVENRRQQRKGS